MYLLYIERTRNIPEFADHLDDVAVEDDGIDPAGGVRQWSYMMNDILL